MSFIQTYFLNSNFAFNVAEQTILRYVWERGLQHLKSDHNPRQGTDLLLENIDDRHRCIHVGVEPLLQRLLVVVAPARASSSAGQAPERDKATT